MPNNRQRAPRFLLLRSLAVATLLAAGQVAPARLFGQDTESQSTKTQSATSQQFWDGSSLEDWDGDPKYWSTKEGALVGEIPPGTTLNHNTWLVLKDQTVSDFELRLQFKLTGAPAANSGIQFRCQVDSVDHVSGYQADLDMGATWLGRIYDEHGRALLVERGSRVHILPDGKRKTKTFSAAGDYEVFFRENDWNDYRIVAVGQRVDVFVNGTLFSQLWDEQIGQTDLEGSLAFQLHSGPETKIQFRNILLNTIAGQQSALLPWKAIEPETEVVVDGKFPQSKEGKPLNLGFESGDLQDWTAVGNAFKDQPIKSDGISRRWPGQSSGKQGNYFIGGYEVVHDGGIGTLTSAPFAVNQPFASFLFAGGQNPSTRIELLEWKDGQPGDVFYTASGIDQEQMSRAVVDLTQRQGQSIAIRLVDENAGAWGHLNFDDFRFHEQRPKFADITRDGRTTYNPLLQHLVPNPAQDAKAEQRGSETTAQMFVPEGFSVDVIAAEPDLHQPMAFTFDARGRLWIVEGHCYPQKRPAGEGLDRILIFSDEDNDGHFESRKVFVEGLNLVSGMQVGHGGVWIGAAPQLLFIPDRDGDDQPDGPAEVLLDGFGYADTHETVNSFMWGPDGWLYGNQGVFNASRIGKPGAPDSQRVGLGAGVWRYHPVRHQFEVFAHGGSNQWGLDYDQHGQLFITHCRSYWGQGSTTHVIQNGHYWNQINGSYAPFVSANALPFQPGLKNYLLASARYGHGEGGAGKRGSRKVYGGHSHVGTMIYLGDNWPETYRNHLFTHNLHGHQMNQQVNLREAGGYNTVHAGADMLLCTDPQFIGVDLQYGPDGAVYFSDWYDPRHCHNPDWEMWDRGNGRMYRMQYDATFQPVSVDYASADATTLVQAQSHRNAWHARAARLELAYRAAQGKVAPEIAQDLAGLVLATDQPTTDRLNALWALHLIGGLEPERLNLLLDDSSEYLRSWAIQLGCETSESTAAISAKLIQMAEKDPSLMVRRYLASAASRLDDPTAWAILEKLAGRDDQLVDRELPSLIWFALAQRMPGQLERSLEVAQQTAMPVLRDQIYWYAAKLSPEGRQAVVQQMNQVSTQRREQLLHLFALGIRGMRGLAEPEGWQTISAPLYRSEDVATRQAAEGLGAAFGDQKLFQQMDQILLNPEAAIPAKRNALRLIDFDSRGDHLNALLANLDQPELTAQVLPMLKRYSDASVAGSILKRYARAPAALQPAMMEVLCSRVSWSNQLLDQIEQGEMDKTQLTAFFARQMSGLENAALNRRLEMLWGKLGQSSAERKAEIAALVQSFNEAPKWAYSEGAGATHFKQICASCHQDTEASQRIAPRLEGTGSKGIDYIVENVLDPNAVIGQDFQARLILTVEGRVISGLVIEESDSAITIRTATGSETVARDDIEEIKVSDNSFMPEGLLKTLNEQQKIELLKYLMSL